MHEKNALLLGCADVEAVVVLSTGQFRQHAMVEISVPRQRIQRQPKPAHCFCA